jgi:adenylate cyclase
MTEANGPSARRHAILGIDLPGSEDDPLASGARSSLTIRLGSLLTGLALIGIGGLVLVRGWDAALGGAMIGTGLIRFLAAYLARLGHATAASVINNITGALILGAAILEIGDAAGLEAWALLVVALPPLLTGPQHGRLRAIAYAASVGLVAAAEIAARLVPPRLVLPPGQLSQVRAVNLAAAAVVLWILVTAYRRMLDQAERRVGEERKLSERLLANILPAPIAARLKRAENPIAEGHETATILFADMVDFTEFAARNRPEAVVALLNRLFYAFDDMVERHGVEKIKTIGDAYMVAGGLTGHSGGAAEVADLAIEMLGFVRGLQRAEGLPIDLRIGIHTGPLVAGVIGKHKFSYDVWGDTVNVAARLETASEAGRILISEATARALGGGWRLEPRGPLALKGVGEVKAYFLVGPAAAAAAK